jgi:hypothetical protein
MYVRREMRYRPWEIGCGNDFTGLSARLRKVNLEETAQPHLLQRCRLIR